jgi:hypothetical protein
MSIPLTFADVAEGVRAAIAAYTQALDDGRADDVVATFCPDGMCDMPGLGRRQGQADLLEAYRKWAPKQPQRHLVLNTLITQWSEQEAHATSDVVFLLKDDRSWNVQFVGRYADVLERDGAEWRFRSRVATFS